MTQSGSGPRAVRDVVFVDGARTPFGKAKGVYAETRADDLVVKVIRELLRRNPSLPPERVDEVAIAATTQIGDQGLTIGRSAALLAGLPKSVPGFAIDRMCAGAMTAVTSVASAIGFGDVRRRHRRRRRAHGPPPDGRGRRPQPALRRRQGRRPVRAHHGLDGREPARPLPRPSRKERCDAFAAASQAKVAKAYAVNAIQPDLVPVANRSAEARLGPGHHRRAAPPGDHGRRPRRR